MERPRKSPTKKTWQNDVQQHKQENSNVVVSNTIDYYNTKVSVFKAGQISGRIFQWKNLKHDKDIKQIIKGVKIEFQNEPPVNPIKPRLFGAVQA